MLPYEVPKPLIRDILEGRCVAFVGAGFSAGAAPGWKGLLKSLAASLGERASGVTKAIDSANSAFELEAVGQLLRECFDSRKAFEAQLEATMNKGFDKGKLGDRVKLLSEIPFNAILTTNYDPSLEGKAPSPELYRRILRQPRKWWDRDQWSKAPEVPIIKLHGDANGDPDNNPIVLGRGDYRRLVHQTPQYASFLRAVLASRTVLFLGTSFTDAYLNELRSEVVAMLSTPNSPHDAPLAFALVPDRSEAWEHYFLKHEGIQLLGFETQNMTDFSGFDARLRAIHQATAPSARLASLLTDKRIVWIDDNHANNDFGHQVLSEAKCNIEQIDSMDELREKHFDADLILTKFGFRSETSAVAFDVLERLGKESPRPPVIVFASGKYAARNRREVLRRGAFEYASGWGELFGLIERLFGRELGE